MPPQLPWPGEPSSARRRRSAGESAAAWKHEMMSIGSPVRESMPGRIDPSDMITAGTLCSRIAASVPTDQRVPHLGRAVALPVGDPAREVGRDNPHRQILVGDPAAQLGLDRVDLRGDPGVADAVPEVADNTPDRAVD